MNVRLIDRTTPHRLDLYGGILKVESDGISLWLWRRDAHHAQDAVIEVPLRMVAEILLDDEAGGV